MSDIATLIERVTSLGVELWVDGDQLCFSAPKDTLTPELRAALTDHKGEIVSILGSSHSFPRLVPDTARAHDPFPLTDIQQAYWLGMSDAFELSSVTTHVYFELQGHGINVHRAERAWNRLVQRHGMLRAIVLPMGLQQILPAVHAYAIATTDLRAATPNDIRAHIDAIRAQLSHQVLSAEHWPLFDIRATLLPGNKVVLHVSLHVIVADGSSMTLLFREWAQLYTQPDAALPPLDISFRDYVLAEAAVVGSELSASSQRYWLDRLDNLPAAPMLPVRKTLPHDTAQHFQRRSATIPHDRWSRLIERSSRAGFTPSALLICAYADVLATWSQVPRFTLNLTLSNRLPLHEHVDRLVGDFTSVTLLEVDAARGGSFEVRARAMQERLAMDLDHRYVSGIWVMRELARRHGGASRVQMPVVFTSGLALGEQGAGAGALRSLGEVVYGINQTPQVWLDVQVLQIDDGLVINWDAVEDLFPDGVLDAMFEAYMRLLTSLAVSESAWNEPRQSLIPEQQLARRAEYNQTAGPVPRELLHTAFERYARQQPGAPAIMSMAATLSYAELDRIADDLASRLLDAGVRPGELVAVVIDRSWEQVAAVLGVLKAGAAYLPIDYDVGAERRAYLLAEGQVRVALTVARLRAVLDFPRAVRVLEVGPGAESSAKREERADLVQPSTDLAYVIYTSGSTGRPKGVMIDHLGAMNTIVDLQRRFQVGPNDRVLALSQLSFDLSVWDIFGVLGAGGTVVIPDEALRRDPAHWAALMQRFKVTLWNSVPALMQLLLDHLNTARVALPAGPRLIQLSGDWIPLELAERVHERWPAASLVSLGGATEASIWSIVYPIHEIQPEWTSIPYGTPLANQTWHVLDHALSPVPDFVAGELYIGGPGVALGYWHDLERSAAAFLVHPQTHERLYRTGDLGRFHPSGYIELLGRQDLQVKIQGNRVELGEIEAVLQQHPAVSAAAVVVAGERAGPKHLVAYVVAADQDRGEHIAFKLERHVSSAAGRRRGVRLPERELAPAVWLRRQSYRLFADAPVELDALAALLDCLRPAFLNPAPFPKYRYPSAGSLYPVETFVYVKPGRVSGLDGGFYAYSPVDHQLIPRGDSPLGSDAFATENRGVFDAAAATLFLIGDLDAIEPLYGHKGRDLCLIESGYMGQLLMETAVEAGLGLCPLSSVDPIAIATALGLHEQHVFLHGFACGVIRPDQVLDWLTTPPAGKTTPLETTLAEYLRARLPAYMVPTMWLQLNALPLTTNGKIDRAALPDPRPAAAFDPQTFEPASELERAIADIWSQFLGVAKPSVEANFFELGGDSLAATRVVMAMRTRFDIDLPLRQLLDAPTIRGQAALVEVARRGPVEEGEL